MRIILIPHAHKRINESREGGTIKIRLYPLPVTEMKYRHSYPKAYPLYALYKPTLIYCLPFRHLPSILT